MIKIDFKMPEDLEFIINKIETLGFEAWCVGGAVRDTLLGKTPEDYDVATSMPPEMILETFEKVIPTGIRHGTVTVVLNGKPYEVTRFRIDGEYLDHRKPETVEFTDDFTLDLSRRDFTINAMGYNKTSGLMDPFGGVHDLENKLIRTVGEPQKRFKEDALRILRAVRFSSVLGFELEDNTKKAVEEMAHTLKDISAERIAVELFKTLKSQNPNNISLIINGGGFSEFGMSDLKTPEILNRIPNVDCLRLSVLILLCDGDAKKVTQKLKLSREQCKRTVAFFDVLSSPQFSVAKVKKLAEIAPYESLKYLASAFEVLYSIPQEENFEALRKAAELNEPYNIKMLNISGDTLKSLGYVGKEIGEVQEKLLNFVLENPNKNTESELLKQIGK